MAGAVYEHRQVAVGFVAFAGTDALIASGGAAELGARLRAVAASQRPVLVEADDHRGDLASGNCRRDDPDHRQGNERWSERAAADDHRDRDREHIVARYSMGAPRFGDVAGTVKPVATVP